MFNDNQLFEATIPETSALNSQLSKNEVRFVNRDLSLVEFFNRVLEEAQDSSQPLLERIKFLSILAANIDEFYMVRIPGLIDKAENDIGVSRDGISNVDLLDRVRSRLNELMTRHADIFTKEIIPELANNQIYLTRINDLPPNDQGKLATYFEENIYATLTPQAVDPAHPFPYISGGSVNLGLKASREIDSRALSGNDDTMFVRIKIPQTVPRFVPLDDSSNCYVFVEDLIAHNIKLIIPGAEPADCHPFRITRAADVELCETDSDDLLEMMEVNLRQRRFGDVVRLEVSTSMPAELTHYIAAELTIDKSDVYVVDGPLNLIDTSKLAGLNRPDLKDKPLRVSQVPLVKRGESMFDLVKRHDIMMHHPFMPYSIVTDLIKEAAEDPDVLAIKMCLYRLGPDSPIPPLLIRASELGKEVTVLIELKARFDEENNIAWAKQLEQSGIHVIYGLLGLKTHAKTTLIVRREADKLQRYVHTATGNYNPETSAVYTDLGLLTIDEQIGSDATELFNFLTVYSEPTALNKLLVAPINLRERMLQLIETEATNAKQSKPARIIAKINRLADPEIVEALYTASIAGVEIDLIIRGICTLRPGVPGLSDNIRVRSIVGRLLEHSRVYYFENGDEPVIFIGSSDWMPRNLDRRVEVLTPVEDAYLRHYLRDEYLSAYLRDNVKARELQPDGTYRRVLAGEGQVSFDSQSEFQGNIQISQNYGN
ncbi:MAG: polyphosphate kinase 1 [Pyrinomonadaceae bacterium]